MPHELDRRARLFGQLRGRALRARAPDDALFWASASAAFAYSHNPGLWHDPRLDRLLDDLSEGFAPERVTPKPGSVAHLVSLMASCGGHTEIVREWAAHAGSGIVSSELEESDPSTFPLPARLCPPGLGPSDRVRWLARSLSELRPETIILHTNPHDSAALTAALAYRRSSGARLLIMDHADTAFWLGSTLADRVLCLYPSRLAFARQYRGVQPDRLSFVPLTARRRDSPPVSRESLGVPSDATLSLTAGAHYKMTPDGHFDYARTLSRVMEENPSHWHMMVGHGGGGDRLKKVLRSERVLWLGRREDVDALLDVCDFVIESFPLMGGMFRLDCMRAGRAVLAISHPASPELWDTGALPPDYPLAARTNEEVLRLAKRLIDDGELRRGWGALLRRRFGGCFPSGVVAAALRAALDGVPAPEAAPLRLRPGIALTLSPGGCDYVGAVARVSRELSHSPRSMGLRYWAGRAGASLRHRLGRAPQRG